VKKKFNIRNINWKEFRNGSIFIAINIAVAIGVLALLLWALKSYLHDYTEHGIEVEVPNIKGVTVTEAKAMMESEQLKLVVIDSTYSDKVPFGTIVEQDPTPNSHVKHGRPIYVTINASGKRKVQMPDLRDISYRQAEATLRGLGLIVDEEYDYEPSEFRDLVLDVKADGKSINAGEKLAVGTRVRLVVGFGRGTEEVIVPNVVGMTIEDARSLLLQYRLTIGAVLYDQEDIEAESEVIKYIYRQTPNAGETVIEGEAVTLRLSSDIEKAAATHPEEEEEEDIIW
jgi:hypothetical protein